MVFRKAAGFEESEAVSYDCLVLYPSRLEARLSGGFLELTQQEFSLLLFLVRQSGRLVLKQAATRWLWQEEGHEYDRRLTVLISRLRGKLAAAGPYTIETVRKRGFRLQRSDP